MTDNQKVYIHGVDGRGDEVIAALINLGAKTDLFGGLGDNPDRIYYIKHNGHISFTGIDTETGKIIVDHYQEIKLPKPKPKPWEGGDILTDCGKDFCVFLGYSEDSPDKFIAYTSLQSRFLLRDDKPLFDKENYRLATQQEIVQFHELLHKHGKDWALRRRSSWGGGGSQR